MVRNGRFASPWYTSRGALDHRCVLLKPSEEMCGTHLLKNVMGYTPESAPWTQSRGLATVAEAPK